MTDRTASKDGGRPDRTRMEEIRVLRSRLARFERSEVEHGHPEEQIYRSLVMDSPQGVLILQDGRVVLANQAMATLAGYSIDELKAASPEQIRDFVHPEDRDTVLGRYRDRLAGKPAPEHYEFRAIGKSREVRWIAASTRAIGYGGRPAVYAAFTDVTDRKRAEEHLRESERRYRIVADNTYDWEFWIGPGGRFLYNSPSCYRITGYTAEDFVREPDLVDRLLYPEDRDYVMRHCALASQRSAPDEIEHRIVHADGSVRHIAHICQPVFDEHGRYQGIRGSNRDITGRKQAERNIALLSFALNNMHEAAFLIDKDGHFLFVNQEACRVLGYTREELLALDVRDIDSDLPSDYWPDCWDYVKEHQPQTFERRHRAKDGHTFPVEVNANYFEYDGQAYGMSLARDITERKRVECHLRDSEERYRLVFENSPVSIWEEDFSAVKAYFDDLRTAGVTDIESYLEQHPETIRRCTQLAKIVDVNRASVALHEAAGKSELLARLAETFTPESHETFRQKLVCLWKGGTEMTSDGVLRTLAGRLRHVTVSFSVCPGYEKSLGKVYASLTDDTERKQAEEALRESEARFRDLYENAPNAYVTVGVDGIIHRCNRRAGELLGRPAEDLVGRPVIELYADTTCGKEKAQQVLRRFKAGEAVRDEELQMQRADGNPVWVSLTVDPVRDAQGRIVESRSMAVEITERKRAQSIKDARQYLLQFAQSHSLDELLTATLDEMETLTGSTIGFYHFLASDQKTLTLQTWSSNTLKHMCTAQGKGRHYDIAEAGVWVDCIRERRPVIHNDYACLAHRKGMPPGHARVVRELVVPVFRGDKIVAVLGVGNKPRDYGEDDVHIASNLADLAWDIAERKRAEIQAQERRAELLHVSRLNTLGEMASGLAHELSQPLSAIVNNADACARRMASSQADGLTIAQGLEKIAAQAKRAGGILGRIKALAQRRPPQFESTDVNKIVEDVIDLVSWEARHKEVPLKTELDQTLPVIRVDRIQIEQVVLNLVRNAIEAMGAIDQGHRLLTVRTRTDADGLVRVEVCDTGVGLPKDNANRVFEPFFTTKANGLGVGLSISRTIAEMHNGTLDARPNVECGSTFVLVLPVAQPGES